VPQKAGEWGLRVEEHHLSVPGIASLSTDVGRIFWDLPRSRQHRVSTLMATVCMNGMMWSYGSHHIVVLARGYECMLWSEFGPLSINFLKYWGDQKWTPACIHVIIACAFAWMINRVSLLIHVDPYSLTFHIIDLHVHVWSCASIQVYRMLSFLYV
jgi:hypothetical protein